MDAHETQSDPCHSGRLPFGIRHDASLFLALSKCILNRLIFYFSLLFVFRSFNFVWGKGQKKEENTKHPFQEKGKNRPQRIDGERYLIRARRHRNGSDVKQVNDAQSTTHNTANADGMKRLLPALTEQAETGVAPVGPSDGVPFSIDVRPHAELRRAA